MPFVRFSRDRRGYEHVYLVQPAARHSKGAKPRVLYWYRTPPGVKVGREPFDPALRRALEARYPDVSFDWEAIVATPMPPPEIDWRERRRARRAARQASLATEAEGTAEGAAEAAAEELTAEGGDQLLDAVVDEAMTEMAQVSLEPIRGELAEEPNEQRGGARDEARAGDLEATTAAESGSDLLRDRRQGLGLTGPPSQPAESARGRKRRRRRGGRGRRGPGNHTTESAPVSSAPEPVKPEPVKETSGEPRDPSKE